MTRDTEIDGAAQTRLLHVFQHAEVDQDGKSFVPADSHAHHWKTLVSPHEDWVVAQLQNWHRKDHLKAIHQWMEADPQKAVRHAEFPAIITSAFAGGRTGAV